MASVTACGVGGYSLHKLLEIDANVTALVKDVDEEFSDNHQLVVGKAADLIALSAGGLSFLMCSLYAIIILSGLNTINKCMDTGTRIMVRYSIQ